MPATREVAVTSRPSATWAFSRPWDLVIALCWLPVFLVTHLLVNLPGAGGRTFLEDAVAIGLLISFVHQPLTFGLVYGDGSQFRLHRRLFVVAPIVAITVAVIAAFANLAIVIPIAAVWNLQHTLQQRYGIQRIYAGRSGYGSARLDRALSYVPMLAALAAVAASPALPGLVIRSNLDPMNAGAVHMLTSLRPAAAAIAVVAGAASLVVIGAIARQEAAAGARANPAKWLYQASSIALVAGLVVDPAAGFVAYVAAHAIEYAVVVDRTAKRRYAASPPSSPAGGAAPSLLGRIARTAPGRVAYFAAIGVVALVLHLTIVGPPLNAILYSVGALHFTYDAVIWKLRKPAVAKDFLIRKPPAGLAAS